MSEPDPAQGRPTNFQIMLPSELEAGVYANFLAAWHTAYEFTLDFAATQPAQATDADDSVNVPCRVVARVKMPVTLVFDVIRALNEQMTKYESEFGEIRRPRGPEGKA